VTDYLVYREGDELKVAIYSHYREEDLLLRNFVPGESLVVIPGLVATNLDEEARRQADMYFRGTYQDSHSIDCWVAGALQRQACLKPQ
jgi:hypothetical protein